MLFSSGPENKHLVKPILEGKRYTLTIWFTKDVSKSLVELKHFDSANKWRWKSLWETDQQREALVLGQFKVALLEPAAAATTLENIKVDFSREGTSSSMYLKAIHDESRPTKVVCFTGYRDLHEVLRFLAYVHHVSGKPFGSSMDEMNSLSAKALLQLWKQFNADCQLCLSKELRRWKNESTELVGTVKSDIIKLLPKALKN